MTAKLSITIASFKPWKANTLHGFVDIIVPEMHLRIDGCTVHESHGRRWIGLPAKPLVGRDGVAQRDERGKISYAAILQFTDRNTANAFSDRAIEALIAKHGDIFTDDDGGAS